MTLLKNKIFVITMIVFAVLAGGYYYFFTDGNDYEIIRAEIGDVTQEIFETGSIKGGDRMSLSFKESGRIISIGVSSGDKISSGGVLARLDDGILRSELNDAEAGLRLAEAQLNRLLAGASSEEIIIAEIAVKNAEVNLENIIKSAEISIKTSYEEALTAMDDARIKVRDTAIFVDDFQRDYFAGGDSGSISVRWAKTYILSVRDDLNEIVQGVDVDNQEGVDDAISKVIPKLGIVTDSLETIIDVSESFLFKNIISDSEVSVLKNFQSSVNASISQVVGIREAMSGLKNSNESSIRLAEGTLNLARGELDRMVAGPREEDIELRMAEVERAKSRIAIFEKRINDAVLRAPVTGQVADVYKRTGEIVSPGEPVISFLSDDLFRVEVDIYEGDVSKLEIGTEAEIRLVAFPGRVFYGELASIDPAESVTDNIVYYRVLINAEDLPSGAKPSMTVDVRMITDKREGVVTLPRRVIIEEEGKSFVMLKNGEEIRRTEIEKGLIGDDRTVEIISGIKAGDEIVIMQ